MTSLFPGVCASCDHILQWQTGIACLLERLPFLVQFGEIDIDSELVAYKENVEGDQFIMMLNNGCLCCTVKDDLLDMLEELVPHPLLPLAQHG